MDLPKWAPYKRGPDIEQMARCAVRKACGELQNLMQPDAWYELFDAGGIFSLGIKPDVQNRPSGYMCEFDQTTNSIIMSTQMYGMLPSGTEEVKIALAEAIGAALLFGSDCLALSADTQSGQPSCKECDPKWQLRYFVLAFLMPKPLLQQCRKDGMSENRIAEYFGVSLTTLKEWIEML